MTIFDYIFLGLLIVSSVVGVWRGLVSEIFSLVGWVLACYLAKLLAPTLAPMFAHWFEPEWLRWAAAFISAVVVILIVLAVVRMLIREFLKALGISPIDRFLGACFGVLRALLISLIAVTMGGMTQWPEEEWWQDAMFARPLETAVLALKPMLPSDLAKHIQYR